MDEVCCEQARPHNEALTGGAKTPYKPSKKELLKQWDINIKFVDYGCIIGVGCKKFAFSNIETAMKELNDYVFNPAEAVEKWEELTK